MDKIETIDKDKNIVENYKKKEIQMPSPSDDEINLIEVLQVLWDEKKSIVKTVIIASLFGLIYGLISPEEYEVEIKLLPEISSKAGNGMLSQLGGLASLGGFDLNSLTSSNEVIRPDLYPNITNSLPAILHFMNHEVYVPSQDTTTSVYTFLKDLNFSVLGLIKSYTIGLPQKVKTFIFNDGKAGKEKALKESSFSALSITKEEKGIVENLRERISISIDKKTGIISLSVKMPDPFVAADLANISMHYLTDYVTQYHLEKTKTNLSFIEERHKEAEKRFRKSQKTLAAFRDQNANIATATAKTEEEVLQSEFNLSLNIFNNLSQQLEQAKIKVQEETPVFKILEPVQIPVEKSEPKRSLILIISIILGGVFGASFILIKNYIMH